MVQRLFGEMKLGKAVVGPSFLVKTGGGIGKVSWPQGLYDGNCRERAFPLWWSLTIPSEARL